MCVCMKLRFVCHKCNNVYKLEYFKYFVFFLVSLLSAYSLSPSLLRAAFKYSMHKYCYREEKESRLLQFKYSSGLNIYSAVFSSLYRIVVFVIVVVELHALGKLH